MQWLGGEPISHSNGMHLAHTLAALFSVCGQYMATVFRARTNTCTQRMFHKCAFSESWYVVAVSPPLPALKTQHNKWWAKCKRRRRSQKRERKTRARSRHSPLHMPECTSLDRTALADKPNWQAGLFHVFVSAAWRPDDTHTHTLIQPRVFEYIGLTGCRIFNCFAKLHAIWSSDVTIEFWATFSLS